MANPSRGSTLLTPAEVRVLTLAARGLTDKQVAERERITVRTVRFHFAQAQTRLHAKTRVETVAIAIARGIVDLPTHDGT